MFLRRSLYRHISCDPSHRDLVYDGIKPSSSSWDSNKMSASSELIALSWNVMGGGAFLVWPINKPGRLPGVPSLITGHSGPVNDVAFNPFNPKQIASCSDDGLVKIWDIEEAPLSQNITEASLVLSGHSKRVGGVMFHPSAENVLASFSNSGELKIWNIATGEEISSYELNSIITFAAWSPNGAHIAVQDKNKTLYVLDSHSGEVINKFTAHDSPRNVRICWINDTQFITTGFSQMQERQFKCWSVDSTEALWQGVIDNASNILIPFFQPNQNLLYFFSKGASDVHVYEVVDKKPFYYKINSFIPVSHQLNGIAESQLISYEDSQIAKFFVASASKIETFTVSVPRKQPGYNPEFYPLGKLSINASMSAAEFAAGRDAPRSFVDPLVTEEKIELITPQIEVSEHSEEVQERNDTMSDFDAEMVDKLKEEAVCGAVEAEDIDAQKVDEDFNNENLSEEEHFDENENIDEENCTEDHIEQVQEVEASESSEDEVPEKNSEKSNEDIIAHLKDENEKLKNRVAELEYLLSIRE